MKHYTRIIALGLSAIAFAQAEDHSGQIRKGAGDVGAALLAGNYGTVLDLTYPAIVEIMGGREEALGVIEKQMSTIREKGISLTSFKVGDPSEIKAGGSELFAAIPTTLEMKAPQTKIVANSYLVAVSSNQGKSWFYADGSNLTPELMNTIFPKFPKELKLPEKSNVVEKIP
jgi:hypothetical protein